MKIKRKGKFHVYVLLCADGTFYTGSTKDLEKRIELHNGGRGAKYLRGKIPVKLIYTKEYKYYRSVLRAERTIKKLTRMQKEKLVQNYSRRLA